MEPKLLNNSIKEKNMKKSKLREKVLRRLGWPVVKVELTEDHVNDAIDEAKSKFVDFATGKATEQSYYVLPVSAGTAMYELPETVHSVVKTEIPDGLKKGSYYSDSFISYYTLPMGLQQFSDMYDVINNIDMVSTVYMNSYLNMMEQFTISKYIIDYHDLQNQIHITPIPTDDFYLFLLIFSVVPEEILYNSMWLYKYATAVAKKMLGEIRSKYSGVNLPGGGTMNGDRLISEANEEMAELTEALDAETYEGLPILFE